MDKQVSARIIAVISLPIAAKAKLLIQALRPLMQGDTPCLHLHLPSKILPSSWGSISGNLDLLKPKNPDSGPETSEQLSLDELGELRQWIESGRAVFLPAGYAGSMHAVLNTEELKHELEWTIANPWRSGLKDNFGGFPDTIVPFWPDPFRPRLLAETASRYTGIALGVLAPPEDKPANAGDVSANCRFLIFANRDQGHSFQALPSVTINGKDSTRQQVARIQQLSQLYADSQIYLHFEPNENCDNLQGFIDVLQSCMEQGLGCANHIQTNALSDYKISHRQAEIEAGQLLPIAGAGFSLSPDFRWQLSRLPEGRRARSATQERIRSQLLATVPGLPAKTIAIQAEPAIRNRNLLAMMQGSATIMADDFEAHFLEGRFTGFYRQNPTADAIDSIQIGSAIGSALHCGDRSMVMETESAVSFETDYTRGLRETMVLRNEMTRIPGRMTADFLVADRSRHIILDIQIRYPWFTKPVTLDEVRPLTLSFALDDSARPTGISVAWKRHDGGECLTKLLPKQDDKPSPGFFDRGIFDSARKLVDKLQAFTKAKPQAEDTTDWSDSPSLQLFGSSWTISWNEAGYTKGLQICRLPDERNQSAPFEIRLRQDPHTKKLFVDIFPEGRYFQVPSDDLRSLNHHFVLGIFPFFDSQGTIPEMDELINKEVPPFFMVRES